MSKDRWMGLAIILMIILIVIGFIMLGTAGTRSYRNGRCHERGYARAIEIGDTLYCLRVDTEDARVLLGERLYPEATEQ